jgi:hypothetical protein
LPWRASQRWAQRLKRVFRIDIETCEHCGGRMEATVIGPDDKQWDLSFIARYPNAGAFLAMVTDPEYRLAVVHRQAAVLTSRLIRFAPLLDGAPGRPHRRDRARADQRVRDARGAARAERALFADLMAGL